MLSSFQASCTVTSSLVSHHLELQQDSTSLIPPFCHYSLLEHNRRAPRKLHPLPIRKMSSRLVETLDPSSLGPSNPVYANVTTVPIGDMNFVTIAGQVATTPTGEVPSSLEEQIDLCLSKLETCLSAVHGTVHHLTRLVYYFVEHNPETTPGLITEKAKAFLDGHRPASCYLVVKALSKPEFLCEFEAVAVVPR